MLRHALGTFITLSAVAALGAPDQPGADSLMQRQWFEARTAYFNLYSCGPTQEVAGVAARLEQFRDAYSLLAGVPAVASPPIVVMAFPDLASMRPFLPLYQGKPAHLTAFYSSSSDQNLIVLFLSRSGAASLKNVFHEYNHLLMRRNQPYWPIWLSEGMAEIYATFEVYDGYHARIGRAIGNHVRLLEHTPLMPLKELFTVTHDSPEYNERQQQGLFYAESWLLTHYLMLGGNPAHEAGFRQLTPLLRLGQSPEQAFTNAFHTSLPAMENELRRYLARGKFEPLELKLNAGLETPRTFVTRGLTPMEVYYRLGDELLHIGRLEAAESYFLKSKTLAPASPLPWEGLGLLAARRGQANDAVRCLHQAMRLGPMNFLGHYTYAQEKYLLAAEGPNAHGLEREAAGEIRRELQKSLALMPDFGPAHHLLGFFEMVQGQNLALAEQQIERAIQLEPENQSYLLTLAQVQLARRDPAAARRTLDPLRLPYVEPQVRAHAEAIIKAMGEPSGLVH
jgi:tetratricopeptide (TPR) repeat protein